MKNIDELNYHLYSIRNNQWALMHGQIIKSATSIIKLIFIMNAGAIISLLTFIGNKQSDFSFKKLYWSFISFLVGILFVLVCAIMEFFRQDYALGSFNRRWAEELEQSKIDSEDKKKNEQCPSFLI